MTWAWYLVFFGGMFAVSSVLFDLNINLFVFFAGLGIIDYYFIWNRGTYRRCGSKYREFDIGSSGATGIICDNCENTHWVHI